VVEDEAYEARIAAIKLGSHAGATLGKAFSGHLANGTNDQGIKVAHIGTQRTLVPKVRTAQKSPLKPDQK
jgi:hypothetical protein